jgi:hypothetical protein
MSENWHRYLGKKNHQKEMRKQLRFLIIITLGFTIAFTWRQTIFDLSLSLVSFLTHINNSGTLSILASTFITIISLGLIYITSFFLKEPDY